MDWRHLFIGRTRKVVIGVTAAAIVGGGLAVGTGMGNASESHCAGLETALRQNLDFIAGQRAKPDAQSTARIENRQAVVDLIRLQARQAGCGELAAAPPQPQAPSEPSEPPALPAGEEPPVQEETPADDTGEAGDVVCAGSTVTLSGEAVAPAASSGTLPIGTRLRVTNLDNDKSITVEVKSTSGSCVLLNDAAFEEVREPGKFLIRRAVIELVG